MHAENCVKQAKSTLANWKQVKNKSRSEREKWIIEIMTAKNNKPQTALTRSANELMPARNQKEDNCIDNEYFSLKPERMMTAEEIKKKKKPEEEKREEDMKKKIRNKREQFQIRNRLVFKTPKPTGKSKYNKTGKVVEQDN